MSLRRTGRKIGYCLIGLLLGGLLAGCGSGLSSASGGTAGPLPPVALATAPLPVGIEGMGYGAMLSATGGTEPYSFRISGGALPGGVTLQTTGLLNGVPAAQGTYPFSVMVSDGETPAATATSNYSLVVTTRLVFISGALADGQVGSSYGVTLVSGGIGPYVVTVLAGALPAGLAVTSTGELAGVPTTAGTWTAQLQVKDSSGQVATGTLTGLTQPAPLHVAAVAPAVVMEGTTFQESLMATGGTGNDTFLITEGALPAGIALSAAGTISGTATVGGRFQATVQVTDSGAPAQVVTTTIQVTVATSSVVIDPTTVLATVSPIAYGLHTAVYDAGLSDATGLTGTLSTAGIAVLRYPGGSYSDRYHWAQNSLSPIEASTAPACGVVSSGYLAPKTDFGSFVHTLDATGTQALVTVNYGTSVSGSTGSKALSTYKTLTCSEPNTGGQPEEAAAWVAYANGGVDDGRTIGVDAVGFDWRTVGYWASLRASAPLAVDDGMNFLRLGRAAPVGVQYWEVGNEIYYDGYIDNDNTETDLHAPYVYPNGYSHPFVSRAGVSGLAPAVYGRGAAAYITAMRAVDPTIEVGVVVGSAIDPVPPAWTQSVLNNLCQTTTPDFLILHFYPGTYQAVTAKQMLTAPQQYYPSLVHGLGTTYAAACPGAKTVPVFVTETNPNGKTVPGMPVEVSGLFAAHDVLTALESGVVNVDWLELHGGAGSFLTLTDGAEQPGPAYFGIELGHTLAGVGDQLVRTTSSNAAVLVHAAKHASGGTGVLVINADPATAASVAVTLPGIAAGAMATEISYGVGIVSTGQKLTGTAQALEGATFGVEIPPYSMVEIEVH